MQMRQLQRRDEDLEEAVSHLQHIRLEGKERHDKKHGIRDTELAAKMLYCYTTQGVKKICPES